MAIQDVIDNLDNTIAGKYELLRTFVEAKNPLTEVLKINIDELNSVREDLIEVRDANPRSGVVGQPQ